MSLSHLRRNMYRVQIQHMSNVFVCLMETLSLYLIYTGTYSSIKEIAGGYCITFGTLGEGTRCMFATGNMNGCTVGGKSLSGQPCVYVSWRQVVYLLVWNSFSSTLLHPSSYSKFIRILLETYRQHLILPVSAPPYACPNSTSIPDDNTSSTLLYALKTTGLRTASRLSPEPFHLFPKHGLHSPVHAHGIRQNLQTRLNISIPTIKCPTAIMEAGEMHILCGCPVAQVYALHTIAVSYWKMDSLSSVIQ